MSTTQLRLQGEIVALLERCESLRAERGRTMLVSLLSDALGEQVSLEGSEVHLQLLGLVRWCCRHAVGLRGLVDCLRLLDPNAPEIGQLVELADEWAAFRALPTGDWDRLAKALRSVRLSEDPFEERRELRRLADVATDGHCDDLPARCHSVWSLFLHLADHNAGPGALLPAMVLVDCLAGRIEGGALAAELRRYNWRLAEKFDVTDLVEQARWRNETTTEDDDTDVVHLVFEVDPDPVDQAKVVLSHWLSWKGSGWHGRRRGDAAIRRDDLEAEVDRVIAELESELGITPAAERVSAIVVEFALPWEMINTAVEFWPKASPADVSVPLAVDHPVLVRSLERTRAQRYWLVWKQRWNAISAEAARPYWSRTNGGWDLTGMAVDLNDTSIVSLVLSEPPGDRRGRAWHEAAMAFRAGIPIIIWDREDCSTSHFHEAVTQLFASGEVRRLPDRLARLRREALLTNESDGPHAGRSLAVLWDDAERLPEPLTSGWGSQGGI
ncbi:effector-associated domain 2-containing protein [Actinosynnema sp. CA-299493]